MRQNALAAAQMHAELRRLLVAMRPDLARRRVGVDVYEPSPSEMSPFVLRLNVDGIAREAAVSVDAIRRGVRASPGKWTMTEILARELYYLSLIVAPRVPPAFRIRRRHPPRWPAR